MGIGMPGLWHQEDALEALVRAQAGPGDIVVCLGAGTISAWANRLPERLSGSHL
jgi:UDP-N-acetylmuramate--alanine ligase